MIRSRSLTSPVCTVSLETRSYSTNQEGIAIVQARDVERWSKMAEAGEIEGAEFKQRAGDPRDWWKMTRERMTQWVLSGKRSSSLTVLDLDTSINVTKDYRCFFGGKAHQTF